MDEPESYRTADDNTNGDDAVIPPTHVEGIEHHQNPEQGHESKHAGDTGVAEKPYPWRKGKNRPWGRRCWIRSKRAFRKTSWDRRVELVFAFFIVVFALTQLIITVSNNRSTSEQVGNLIASAKRIQCAAESFSVSASDISSGISDAVGKLQGQVAQSTRAADDAENFFRVDERAWLEIETTAPKPYKDSNDMYVYDLFPKNVGKTAARDIVVRADNRAFNRQSIENTRHPDWIHNLQDKYLLGKFGNMRHPPLNRGTPVPSVLGPGSSSPIPIEYIVQTPEFFPGGGAMISEVLGRIDYKDEFGIPHWIRYCFYSSDAQGHLASCEAGNDDDHNPEVPKSKTAATTLPPDR